MFCIMVYSTCILCCTVHSGLLRTVQHVPDCEDPCGVNLLADVPNLDIHTLYFPALIVAKWTARSCCGQNPHSSRSRLWD
jgi:hypothetical protein